MKKNILKHTAIDNSFPEISPAKNFIPEWFKNADRFPNGIKDIKRFPIDPTFKLCSSFSDSFISGYMIPLPVDIAVEQTENGPIISWRNNYDQFVELRDSSWNPDLPAPEGYSPLHFAWKTKHMFEIPKGYSALITHPLNRYELPFITLSGIVDGHFVLYNGSIPVYFSNKFEGVISAGTPIMQIILFKTENWKSVEDASIIEKGNLLNKKSSNAAFGWYKKNIWKKKIYD